MARYVEAAVVRGELQAGKTPIFLTARVRKAGHLSTHVTTVSVFLNGVCPQMRDVYPCCCSSRFTVVATDTLRLLLFIC